MLQAQSISYKTLIHSITLDFMPGVIYGIIGPNGAGKSTFLKTITGIWKPTSGKVLWNEQELHQRDRREISKTISLVPQNAQIPFEFSAEEIVAMGRYPHGPKKPKSQDRTVIEWALTTVDVWHLRHRKVNELSQGERQRVYIARALVTESPILLLDEPTASLDIQHQLEIWNLLKNLVNQNKVIVVTTHDLMATERFCDHIAVIHEGKCLAEGLFSQVMTPNLLKDVFGVRVDNSTHRKSFSLLDS